MSGMATMAQALKVCEDRAWCLQTDGYDALRQDSIQSRFAISNGFLGARASRMMTQGASWGKPERVYIAGMFDTDGSLRGGPGLVPVANWLRVRLLLPGGPMVHHPSDVSAHRLSLDMKRGVLLSEGGVCATASAGGQRVDLRIRTLRLLSLDDRAVALQLVNVEVAEGDEDLTIEAWLEDLDFGLIVDHLDQSRGLWHTRHSGKSLALASDLSVRVDGTVVAPVQSSGLKSAWTWRCRPGQTICFQHIVAAVRADGADQDPALQASDKLSGARKAGWQHLVQKHRDAWSERWHCSDVAIEGDTEAQIALRFAAYHLNSAANPDDDRVSIGARALTGDDYHGHVFWDTEIYLLPFYVMTWPRAARSLLMYRFRTLDGARAKAARLGWQGALYAWESAGTGAETTPDSVIGADRTVIEVLCGRQEQHISADVAYAVWQYWWATGDDGFLCEAGAEILLETGRFWASRAEPEADGFCHIRGVIGPDEYHETIDDNAFTNVMARWNIRRAIEAAGWLQKEHPADWQRLSATLGLDDAELLRWARVADTMMTGLDPATGLYEQFAGFFKLKELDLSAYEGRSVPMDVILGRSRIAASQVVKQADVVALLALLPDEFGTDSGLRNFRYYEPRCDHGSSLSRAMHGLVAARLGLSAMALGFYRKAAMIDLDDTRVGSDGGIHIAAQGGNWLTVVFGFGGLGLLADGVALKPQLPPGWSSLAFSIQWRGRTLRIRISGAGRVIDATLEPGDAMQLVVDGVPHRLEAGATVHVDRDGSRAAA